MDQLKVILKQVQKHHFWLLCVVAMIASLVGWFMARKSLSATYEQKKSTIVGKFSELQTLAAVEFPPNDEWTKSIGKFNDDQKKTVQTAWTTVYDEQKKQLVWPAYLSPAFLKFVNENADEAQITPKLCGNYMESIPAEFPELLKIVDAAGAESTKLGATTEPAKPGKEVEAHEYKVVWDTANQKEIEESLNWSVTPSSIEVRQTQENLWVYAALLKVIKAMNDGKYVSPVKQISMLQIGRSAAAAFEDGMKPGHIKPLSAPGGPVPGAEQQPPVNVDPAAAAAAPAPDEGRYVNADGKRLPAGEAAKAQFKRMPIFLRLKIDQREISRLLVECANSPLPVEVRQLRINPVKQGGGSSPAAPRADQATLRNKLGGSMGGGTGKLSGGAVSAPAASATAAVSDAEANEMPIELLGIIYIYNKPDMSKLAGQEGGAPPMDGGGTPGDFGGGGRFRRGR